MILWVAALLGVTQAGFAVSYECHVDNEMGHLTSFVIDENSVPPSYEKQLAKFGLPTGGSSEHKVHCTFVKTVDVFQCHFLFTSSSNRSSRIVSLSRVPSATSFLYLKGSYFNSGDPNLFDYSLHCILH